MAFTNYFNGLTARNKGYYDLHSQYVPTRSAMGLRQLVIPMNFADGTTAVTTNFTFPANSVILPTPFIYVRTAEATGTTKTIEVGITGTAAAFINGLSVAATGLKQPVLTDAAVTMGTKLFVYSGATSTAPVPTPDIEASAVALTWTPGSTDWAEFDGDLILHWYQFADLTNMPVNTDIANVDLGG